MEGVVDIKDELERIQSFLKDADARVATESTKQDINKGVKTWVKQVDSHLDVAIDQYLLHVAQIPCLCDFIGFLYKITYLLK
jgi:disease resistance protein RPM1